MCTDNPSTPVSPSPSPLLQELQAVAAQAVVPGTPQSHRESVEFFLRIAARLEAERETITSAEFTEVLHLLPVIYPTLLSPKRLRLTAAPGVPVEELRNLVSLIDQGMKDPDFSIVVNYPLDVEVLSWPLKEGK